MKAELRTIRDETDELRTIRDVTDGYVSYEYESYLVITYNGKSMPYVRIPDDMPDDVLQELLDKINAPDDYCKTPWEEEPVE